MVKRIRDSQIALIVILASILFMLMVIGILWDSRSAAMNHGTAVRTTSDHPGAVPHTRDTHR